MESIYYVLTWACHRRCKHCYDTRFRPYVRQGLEDVLSESDAHFRKVIANLPDTMTYLDPANLDASGNPQERIGRVILAGGEVLLDPVRERIFYPALEALNEKYGRGGVRLSIQTTGDLVTPQYIDEMLERNVWMIAIAGMDDFHVGMEGDKRLPLVERLTDMFEAAGIQPIPGPESGRDHLTEDGPFYFFFGAQPDKWIGELWPRGRAWENSLSKATMDTNFCARHSGGRNFLNYGMAGSEVAIEPDGSVYPCCLKTKLPIGNVAEEPLIGILESLKGHPVFEALNEGAPERMGLSHGWSQERFFDASHTELPNGKPFANLCIGCDRFHEEIMEPVIRELTEKRRASSSR
ncbi:MAG: SPASM domain-containing protein [Parvibaculaceae bacterium]